MTERPGEHLEEEPQEARGARGSRDAGDPPGEGPADRPADDRFAPEDASGVNPQGPIDDDMTFQPRGDQGD
jgi:hypothetical protein